MAASVAAQSPDVSPRPVLRPGPATASAAGVDTIPQAPDAVTRITLRASPQAPAASVRPPARPRGPTPGVDAPAIVPPVAAQAPTAPLPQVIRPPSGTTRLAIPRSPRPGQRPDGLEQGVRASAARQTPARVAQPGTPGAICGQPGLVGERLDPIVGRSSGCGIAEPVRLRAVDGVTLSTPATVNCQTARALQTWVQDSVIPTVGRAGGGVQSLRVVASYACRTRNNQPGARISEHGRGNAIDIAGIGLANGDELTILTDWRRGRDGRMLRAMHSGACGPFGTVLGPNSDRFHQDHFHFDVASYRSGPYCR
jgi:hypothetical protein